MRPGRVLVRATAIVVFIMTALAVPSSALAKPSPVSNSCVLNLEYLNPSGPEAQVASQTCFATFSDALAFATNGSVAVSLNVTPGQVTEAMLQLSLASTVVIGIDWDSTSYNGSSQVWTASNGCDFSHWWQVSYVGDAWNDRTESAKGFGGCVRYRHFEQANSQGSVRTCTPNCSSMGTMANKTSSEEFDDGL
jgi:hypothetical protein